MPGGGIFYSDISSCIMMCAGTGQLILSRKGHSPAMAQVRCSLACNTIRNILNRVSAYVLTLIFTKTNARSGELFPQAGHCNWHFCKYKLVVLYFLSVCTRELRSCPRLRIQISYFKRSFTRSFFLLLSWQPFWLRSLP